MTYLFEASYLLGATFLAAIITAAHTFVQSVLCKSAVHRLHAIQDEMGELCQGETDDDTNLQMDRLAHEAAKLLARFDIDYWTALENQPSRKKDGKKDSDSK
jgi:hypothetical protein